MHRTLLPAVLTALFVAAGVVACGGGSGGGTSGGALDGSTGATPFSPSPPPSVWAADGCSGCHGSDGAGGTIGPNIQCTSFATLDAHVRSAGTTHVGGSFPSLTDQDLLDLEAFLRTPACPGDGTTTPGTPDTPSSGPPASHTVNEDGVLHHPDYETNQNTCTACHGVNLEGTDFAPSCASCHGLGDDDAGGTEEEGESENESESEGAESD